MTNKINRTHAAKLKEMPPKPVGKYFKKKKNVPKSTNPFLKSLKIYNNTVNEINVAAILLFLKTFIYFSEYR